MTDALAKAIEDPEVVEKISAMGADTKLYVGKEYADLLDSQLDGRLELFGVTKK